MPQTRKRVSAPHKSENDPDVLATGFEEEEDEDEEEFELDEEEEEVFEDEIVVHFNERTITRRFAANQILKSGGVQARKFAKELHGKNYRMNACEFIETLLTQDENSTERPKFIRAEGLSADERESLELNDKGVWKHQTGPVPVSDKPKSQFSAE